MSRLDCSFCEATFGSLSVANIAVSSENVAMVDTGKVDRSLVYNKYNNGPRTLKWVTPAFTLENSVYSFSTSTRNCPLCK